MDGAGGAKDFPNGPGMEFPLDFMP
jgi:hypothetical protein